MDEKITNAELVLIDVFAQRMIDNAEPLLTVGELKRSANLTDAEARSAVEKLNSRGWLFIASTMNWDDQTPCILLGTGLERARAVAAAAKRQYEQGA